jgi:hypothetical protein
LPAGARRAPAEVAAFPRAALNRVQVSETRIQRFGGLVVARDERWDENVRGERLPQCGGDRFWEETS